MAGRGGGRTRKQAEVPVVQEEQQQKQQQQTKKRKQKEAPAVDVDQQAVQEEQQPQQKQPIRKRKPKETPDQNDDQQVVREQQQPQQKPTKKRKSKDASTENDHQQAIVQEPQQKRKRKQKETRTNEPIPQEEQQQHDPNEASTSGQQSAQEEHRYGTPAHSHPDPSFVVPSGSSLAGVSAGVSAGTSAAMSTSAMSGTSSTAIPNVPAPAAGTAQKPISLLPVTYSSRPVAVSFCSRPSRPRVPKPVQAPEPVPEPAPEPAPAPTAKVKHGADSTKRENKELKRKVRELESHLKSLRAQLQQLQVTATPRVGTQNRTDQHRRRRGTKLSEDERRAILHMYEMCLQEKENGKSVTTADPILRTAVYFGASQNTVRDAILGRNVEDRRTKAMMNQEGGMLQVAQDPPEAQFPQDTQVVSVAHPQFNQFTQAAHVSQVTQVSHVPHITHAPHDPQVGHVPHVTQTGREIEGNVQFPGVWDI
ncbi:MAG: hypothetical protein J3Q66DRAFT_329006 [Benniella sp.]|nr:MAG: hypothetical protein J3Q66DRAFT_329006 [Benniella sp.]